MTLPIPAATARIANQLRNAERKADETLLAMSELMASMLKARANPEVTVHTGQKALIRLLSAQQSILDGSTNLFRCHEEMANLAREMSILDEPGLTEKAGLEDRDLFKAA